MAAYLNAEGKLRRKRRGGHVLPQSGPGPAPTPVSLCIRHCACVSLPSLSISCSPGVALTRSSLAVSAQARTPSRPRPRALASFSQGPLRRLTSAQALPRDAVGGRSPASSRPGLCGPHPNLIRSPNPRTLGWDLGGKTAGVAGRGHRTPRRIGPRGSGDRDGEARTAAGGARG